jgi:hypothetical protein
MKIHQKPHPPEVNLASAIPENRAFLAKFSKPSFRMTNEKFPMTNLQFSLSALVAAPPRCGFADDGRTMRDARRAGRAPHSPAFRRKPLRGWTVACFHAS